MLQLLYSFGAAFIIALILGPLVIPILHRLKFGQSIREEGPQRHLAKAGTPTMGGIILLLATVIPTLLFGLHSIELWLVLFVTIGHGIIGFLDDFIKVVLKRSLGLKARQKLFGQIVMAVGLVFFSGLNGGIDTTIWIPFSDLQLDVGILYYVFVFFMLVGTTNAVNLTDGLDGLAAGTTVFSALAYAVICFQLGKTSLAVFCLSLAGGCLGFLKYNAYPAKVFMGDTGSLALGAALAAVAYFTKTELLLIIIGGVYVIEALSVIIQVISFKSTGKRVFLMSPIHHHFELKGWSEQRVVLSFWLAGALCSVVAVLVFRIAG